MPLTAIDLIKNKLLARLESIEPGKVDHYFEHWNRLLGYISDDYAIQERFFRQYYNAFKDQLKAVHQVPVATRSNLIQIYEKLINHELRIPLEYLAGLFTAGDPRLVESLAKFAYMRGASDVVIDWIDDEISHMGYEYKTKEQL